MKEQNRERQLAQRGSCLSLWEVSHVNKNLIPTTKRTKEEVRAISRKGGLASGKARQQKKAFRAMLKEAVALPLAELPPDLKDAIMCAAKVKDENLFVSDAILGSLVRNACRGNSQMMKLLLEVLGESADIRLRERELKLKESLLKKASAELAAVQILDDLTEGASTSSET